MKSSKLFWLINAAGWFVFLLLTGLFFSALSGQLTINSLAIQLFAWCYYVPASGLVRRVIHHWDWFNRKNHGHLVVVLIGLTLLLAIIGQFLVSLFMMYGLHIMTWQTYSVPVLMMTIAQNWIVLSLWTLLYLVIGQNRTKRQQQLREIKLQSALHKAELLALKAQLNPHFIFNCLNNMRAMTLENAEITRKMITHLSEILKYSFRFSEQTQVMVSEELQHVRNYLALETIHFEQRLRHDIQVDDATLDYLIPPMSIQLLVENAIKHGIANNPNGGDIRIHITSLENHLQITVINDGQLKKHSDGNGIGLKNLRQRLQLFYQDQGELSLQNDGPKHVKACLIIPTIPTTESVQ